MDLMAKGGALLVLDYRLLKVLLGLDVYECKKRDRDGGANDTM